MIFSRNLPWGIVIPIHTVKCTKLIILYAFLTLCSCSDFPLAISACFWAWGGVYNQLTPLTPAIDLFSFAGLQI
jgi:hypothetical protein